MIFVLSAFELCQHPLIGRVVNLALGLPALENLLG